MNTFGLLALSIALQDVDLMESFHDVSCQGICKFNMPAVLSLKRKVMISYLGAFGVCAHQTKIGPETESSRWQFPHPPPYPLLAGLCELILSPAPGSKISTRWPEESDRPC